MNDRNKKDARKSKNQLIEELADLRRQLYLLKDAESECRQLMEKTVRDSETQTVINNLLQRQKVRLSLKEKREANLFSW